jgi:hypothetical protein
MPEIDDTLTIAPLLAFSASVAAHVQRTTPITSMSMLLAQLSSSSVLPKPLGLFTRPSIEPMALAAAAI